MKNNPFLRMLTSAFEYARDADLFRRAIVVRHNEHIEISIEKRILAELYLDANKRPCWRAPWLGIEGELIRDGRHLVRHLERTAWQA